MYSRKKFFTFAAISAFVGVCIYAALYVNYTNSFDHQKAWGDDNWKRLPLWYPYEMAETNNGIELFDWRNYHGGIIGFRSKVADVLEFNYNSNLLWGVKMVVHDVSDTFSKKGSFLVNRYFLLDKDMSCVLFFDDENEFLGVCSRYGVDGRKRESFGNHYMRYCASDGSPAFWKILSHWLHSKK